MIIGVDIDEVVAEYLDALLTYVKNKHNLSYTREQHYTYWFNDVWRLPTERFNQIVDPWRESIEYDEMKVVEGCQAVLSNLAQTHQIVFVTSRKAEISHKTEKWLRTHFAFRFEIIQSANPKRDVPGLKTKAQICKERGIQVMLEDQVGFSQECANEGIPVILFDKPWNQTVSDPGIVRVKSWSQVPDVISKKILA